MKLKSIHDTTLYRISKKIWNTVKNVHITCNLAFTTESLSQIRKELTHQ